MTSSSFHKTLVAILALALAGLSAASAQFITTPVPGGVRITAYTGNNSTVVIPLQIGGATVLEIGNGAFQNKDSITTLTLPSSLLLIAPNAFYDCDNLGSIFIPALVASIGDGAFAACDRLASIEVDSTNGAYTSVDGVLYDLVTSAGNAILHQYPAGRPGNSYAIPQTLATAEPVTSIAARAFEQAQNLLSMEFANNVVAIGANAFENAPRLARVTFDSQVTTIGNSAFSFNGTGRLAFATFLGNAPASFGTAVFSGASAGFEVRYAQGSTGFSFPTWTPSIGQTYNSRAIQTAGTLTYRVSGSAVEILSPMPNGPAVVVIPSTIANLPVRSIAAYAFVGDTNITSVQLPTSLATIGQDAFYGCSSLDAVGTAQPPSVGLNIPANITSIGVGAFGGCPLFQILTVDAANPNYAARDNVLFNKSLKKIIQYPMALADASYDILPSVTEIGERAFEDNLNLTSIEFGVAVTTIGTRAFFNNESLITLRFDRNVSSIGDQAFATSIGGLFSAIFFGDAPNTKPGGFFGANVFQGASPEFEVLYLGGAAGFTQPTWTVSGQTYNSATLNQFQNFLFTTSNGTVEIQAFIGTPPGPGELAQLVPDLTTRPVPNFVGVTDDLVFINYPKPPGIGNIPNYLSLPAGYLFYDTNTDTIWEFVRYVLFTGVIVNWEWRVYNTNNARLNLNPNVSLGTTVIEQNNVGPVIYQKVANPGDKLESWIPVNFEIPDTIAGLPVTSIAPGAFANQRLLQSVVLPDSLTRLGAGAFSGCDELGTLGLVTEQRGVFIPGPVNQIGAAPFVGCQKLQSLFVHSSNPNFTAIDGVLYNKNQTNLIQYPAGKLGMEFTIPSAVTNILESAFEGNRYLALLQTGNNLTTIGDRAFFGSQVLAQARFGTGLNSLGNSSFSSISSLGSVIFSGNWLGNYTFGTEVFYRASDNFVVNYYPGATGFSAPTWTVSGQTYKSQTVNVIGDFQFSTASGFVTITGYLGIESNVTIPSSLGGAAVREIGDSVFAGNDNIISVTIPSSVTTIGNRTFAEATNLATVNFGNGLVSIGLEAFYQCDSLAEVSLPAGVISIGSGAFGNCDKLTAITVNSANPAFSSRDGVLFNKSQSKIVQYPGGLQVETYTFPVTVTTIGERAFEGNGNLFSIDLPNTVTTIEKAAFYGSPSIVQVEFGTRVANFGDEAFAQIPVLSSAIFNGDAPKAANFGASVFEGASAAFKVRYYEGAEGFPATSPSTWTISGQIYDTEFLSGDGDYLFEVANNEVTITGYQGSGGNITIPPSVGGFRVKALGDDVFRGNIFITSVNATSVSRIGNGTFAGAGNLTSVTLGNGLTSIGAEAFKGSGITSILIPAGVTNIGLGAFENCQSLATISVATNNPSFSSRDGILFNRSQNTLICYPAGAGNSEFIVPSTVSVIGTGAFKFNRNLIEVEIPSSVLTINATAFQFSQALVTAQFETGNRTIGSLAFANIPTLGSAIFYGNAPDAQANSFAGGSSDFRIYYLSGATGFTNPGQKSWIGAGSYTISLLQSFGDFEFTTANGTVEITKFIGVPPLANQPPQVKADIDTRPSPYKIVANQEERLALTLNQITFGNATVLQLDTNQLWRAEERRDRDNNISTIDWILFDNNGAYLKQPASLALGITVLEQNNSGAVVYQKIAQPGSNPSDWIQVNFEIPKTIAGLPVTSIAAGAFANNKLLQSVVVPPSVTKIGANAFYNCDLLGSLGSREANDPKGVFIPAAVGQIGTGAFGRCSLLENIFVHNLNPNFKAQDGILYNYAVTSLLQYPSGKQGGQFTAPASVRSILPSSFEGNKYLVVFQSSNSTSTIGDRAFYQSQALVRARFGPGLNALGNSSFSSIPSLGSVVFNGNWLGNYTFGSEVFAGASDSFVIYYLPGGIGFTTPTWTVAGQTFNTRPLDLEGDFEFTTANGSTTITGYRGTNATISIPSTLGGAPVRVIGAAAFANNQNITSVTIPNSVAKIENSAFAGMEELVSVQFGVGLVSIGEDAFLGCSKLLEVTIPAGVTEIGHGAFGACDALQQILVNSANPRFRSLDGVLFDKSQQTLRQYPGGKAGETYEIPETVRTIGSRAFEQNGQLIAMEIPQSVTEVQAGAFRRAFGISQLVIGSAVNTVGDEAFAEIAVLSTAVFQGNVPQSFGANVFAGASSQFQVRYYDGNTGFTTPTWTPAGNPTYAAFPLGQDGDFEFEILNGQAVITGYTGLGGFIEIPSEIGGFPVRTIGANAFANISTITWVELPSTLNTIEEGAFYNCNNLLYVSIPANVSAIGLRAFGACDQLLFLFVDSANRFFSSVSGVLFSKDGTALLQFPTGQDVEDYEIPEGVTRIAEQAFFGNKALGKIYFAKTIQMLESESFASMPSLVAAVFYGNAPKVGANVFQNAAPQFEVQYVPGSGTVAGAQPFPTSPSGGIWNTYRAVPVTNVEDFEFRIENKKVIIEKYTGIPDRVQDYFTVRDLIPQQVVTNETARNQLPTTNAVGYKVRQIDNDTVYILKEVRAASGNNTVAQNVWEILVVDNLTSLEPTIPVGSIVKQQNSDGPIYFQKIANPGSNLADWIRVSTFTLVIPETLVDLPVVEIAEGAFAGNEDLESIKFPNSLTTIGPGAFYGCVNLGLPDGYAGTDRGVFLPASVEQIGERAFSFCPDLSAILVHKSNKNFFSQAGVLFDFKRISLLQYPAGRFDTDYSVPQGVVTITNYSFEGAAYLETVSIPNSCRTIGEGAFQSSQSLSTVSIGTGIRRIGSSAFAGIPSLVLTTFAGAAPKFGPEGAPVPAKEVFAGASTMFKVRFTAGQPGFNDRSVWDSIQLQPIWPSLDAPDVTKGFRAIGTVAPESSLNGGIGGQISLAVSRSRVVTGVLNMGEPGGKIVNHRFRGQLTDEGVMEITIPRRLASNLMLYLQLDLLNIPTYFKFNTNSRLEDGQGAEAHVSAAIVPWSTTNSAAFYGGQYNVALKTDTGDQYKVDPGYGFLTLAINPSTGAVRATGVLADGTKVTTSTTLLGLDLDVENPENSSNTIPLWIPLYRNHGMLWGDLFLQAGKFGRPVTAELLWTKPPGVPRSTNYEGFTDVLLNAEEGSGLFEVPSASRFNNLTLTFDDGVSPTISATFVESKGRIRPDEAAFTAYNMKAGWNLRGGLFQGTFTPSTTDRRLTRYQGIILHNLNAGTFKVLGNFQMPNVSPDKESSFFQGGSVSNN